MSDNRMRIVCRKCREAAELAQWNEGAVWECAPNAAEGINELFKKHLDCHRKHKDGKGFLLFYESDGELVGGVHPPREPGVEILLSAP